MRRTTSILSGLLLFSMALAAPAMADDAAPTGQWDFLLTQSRVQGSCPMGGDGSGTLTILDQGGGALVIQYLTGMACSPGEVCILFGACDGSHCVFSTTAPVDDDGGTVTNSADLLLMSPGRMEGAGGSVYTHPSGFSCTWDYMLTLTR